MQIVNVNKPLSAVQQDNKKLLSVKHYTDYTEKTYLVPATTSEQKIVPALYSLACHGLGQQQNGDNKKMNKMLWTSILSGITIFCGVGLAISNKQSDGKAKLLSGIGLMVVGGITSFVNSIISIADAYKNTKTQVVEITKNEN